LRPRFWTRFQSLFSNLTNFYLDDSVVVAADMWVGSYVGNWFESLVDSGGNWDNKTKQGIGVGIVVLVAYN